MQAAEQEAIHATIATQMLVGGKIDARDADTILMHALLGKSAFCLAQLAFAVLTAPAENLTLLAQNLTFFQMFRTDTAIYPDAPSVAVMLRQAQFKLKAAAEEKQAAAEVANALFREVANLDEGELKQLSEGMALGSVLTTMGVADYLDDWVNLLRRFKHHVKSNTFLTELSTAFDASERSPANIFRMSFWIGTSQLTSVARLEHIIDELAKLEPNERNEWLLPVNTTVLDYAVFVNSPWVAQQGNEHFDAEDAVVRYRRLADKTKDWGIPALTIQCWIARAVVLDEYLNAGDSALEILDQAIAIFGIGALLLRAKAKIFWRREDHTKALDILRSIADKVGEGNSIERAFALREAAISAAKCGDWKQAQAWFVDARDAALSSPSDDMRCMAIGLGADAAVAAMMERDTASALRGLANALAEVAVIDPEKSLRAAYLHRVVRHTVLWMQSKIYKNVVMISGEPIGIVPGSCSNPEPSSSIQDIPLASLDLAWYMLAETEIVAGVEVGIADSLYSHLTGGKIPMFEISLRARRMWSAIEASDGNRVGRNFRDYLDTMVFVAIEGASLLSDFDISAPTRGEIPKSDLVGSAVEQLASDAILSFGLRAVFAGREDKMEELQKELRAVFGATYPGSGLFSVDRPLAPSLDRTVEAMLRTLANLQHIEPLSFWIIGLRFFERINQSNFVSDLIPLLAGWLREGWSRIVQNESFRLARPLRTVPAINAIIANPSNNRAFVAALLLAAHDAVGSPGLAADYAESLRAMAAES